MCIIEWIRDCDIHMCCTVDVTVAGLLGSADKIQDCDSLPLHILGHECVITVM